MEIKTGRRNRDAESPEVSVPPDRGRASRKKAAQKLPHNGNLASRLLSVLRILGVLSAVALSVLAVLLAYRYACTSDLLTLRNVTIEGCRHADPAALESIVRRSGPNMLRIDLTALRSRLEKEPWIRRVELRRILPSSLVIYVQERAPSVIAEVGEELVLLDNEGVILDRYNPNYGKLDVPVFRGLRGDSIEAYETLQQENAERVRLGIRVLTELESGSADYTRAISEIDLSDMRNVKVILVDDTADIFLGDRDFLKRFSGLMANYQENKLNLGEFISADLRWYPDITYLPKQPVNQQAAAVGIKAVGRN